jgi:Sec-independent protein translocase protein TatA
MGITCKPIGKFQSIMRKMENELERQKKEEKAVKTSKKKKNDED